MKRILSLMMVISVIISMISVIPALAEKEELKVYFYEDFVTGYEPDEMVVKSLGSVKRTLANGEYVLQPKASDDGYQVINFGTTVAVPEETKVVIEYKVSGNFYGGSNNIGFHSTTGIPTAYVLSGAVNANAYADKESIAKTDIKSGVTITCVYDNEKPVRDIYVNGAFAGTFDMSSSNAGKKFCDDNVITLNFYNYIQKQTDLYYHYIKVYQAPSDYNSKAFMPALYKNVGKPSSKAAGIIKYDDSFYFNLINGLGFYNEDNLGEYNPDVPMTRLQFAGIIADIMNLSPVSEPKQLYSDVARRDFMSGTLEALYNMGIMRGTGDKTFSPDDMITLPMVSASLVRALGYKEFAEYYSGYEAGYLSMADKVGLFKGVSGTQELKSKDVIRILYNFMNTDIFETVGVSGNNYIKDSTPGNTILKVYHNIGGIRDIVSANEVTSLTSKSGTGSDAVIIGNILLETNGISCNQYLGYNVEAYYDIDKEKLLFVGVTNNNNVIVIDADDFAGYSSEKISYEKETKVYTVSLSVNTDIIYNGKFEAFSRKLFENIENGNITLVDNNNDNKYDVAFINSYVNGVVDTKSVDGMILRFKNNVSGIKLDSYEAYDIKNSAGEDVVFETIAPDNILSIQESKDKSYVLLTVGSGSYIGALSEIYSDGRVTRFNVAGSLIKADPVFAGSYSFLKPGITGEFFTDAYGKIAHYSEMITRNSGLAYLIGMWDQGEMYDEINLKMFTEGKQLVELKTTKNISIDGISGQNSKTLMDYRQLFNWTKEEDPGNPGTLIDVKGKFKPQLVSYKLNDEGRLTKLDTVVYNEGIENPDNTVLLITESSLKYDGIDGAFGETIYLNNGCRVFTIPTDGIASAELKEFDIRMPSSTFRNESTYYVSAYSTSENTYGADILVAKTRTGGGYDSYDHVFVISGITEIWDEEEDMAVKKLSYFHDGYEKSCKVKEESLLAGVSIGDICILNINSENELIEAPKMRYDLDADTDGDENTLQIAEGARGTIHRTFYGVVYGLKENLIKITKDPEPAPGEDGSETPVVTELHKIPDYIYVVDTQKGKVTTGDKSDITDYLRDNVNYSKVVFYETKGYDYDLVIIK